MSTRRKTADDHAAPELDFAATQEIDTAIVEAILAPQEPELAADDFDDTEVMLDLGTRHKPAKER